MTPGGRLASIALFEPSWDRTIGATGQADRGTAGLDHRHPVGLVEHRRGPAKMLRLAVNKVELPGRPLRIGWEFVPLGEAAEEL